MSLLRAVVAFGSGLLSLRLACIFSHVRRVVWTRGQAAAFYLRWSAGVLARHTKLVKDLPSLAKTAVAAAALPTLPEAVVEELKAVAIVSDVRAAADSVVAKGGTPGMLSRSTSNRTDTILRTSDVGLAVVQTLWSVF